MLYTTLELLKKNSACSSGLSTLIASLPSTYSEKTQISLAHIFKSNGFNHALWAMRATTVDSRKVCARMAIEFALQVIDNFEKEFPADKRSRIALEQAEAFLDGKITLKKLESAASAAESAAESAKWSAAAWPAAWAAWAAKSAKWSAAAWPAKSAKWSAAAWAAESAASESAAESEKIFKKWISKSK